MSDGSWPFLYQAFGLTIGSEMEIPEFMAGQGLPEVSIRLDRVPENLEDAARTGVRFQAKPGHFWLKKDRVAKYLVSGGDRVTVDIFPGARDQEVRLYLLGSVFGALLHQRGLLPLHASGIDTGGRCVLFCGGSGTGKSTIASALVKQGYHLHTDDLAVIGRDASGRPVVWPGYPQLKLWEDVMRRMGDDPDALPRVRQAWKKYAVPAPRNFHGLPLPVHTIYILVPDNGRTISSNRLEGIAKFRALTAQTYRFSFVEGLDTTAAHFRLAHLVARSTPLQLLRRPREPFLLDELTAFLVNDWRKAASTPAACHE